MCCANTSRKSALSTAQTLQRRMFVVGLAEIAAHYAEFRINYCCVDNTVVIVVIYNTSKTTQREKYVHN